jgi:hypothetical protein
MCELECVWQVVAHFLRMEEPLPREVANLMARLFLDDPSCNFFYMNYGGCRFNNDVAAAVRTQPHTGTAYDICPTPDTQAPTPR